MKLDAQRASIGNIVDALESKFTPGQVFDQALSFMQSNGSTFLTNLGTSVRNNPVPAVLTSVGLLWLIMSQNRPPTPRPGYQVVPDQNRVGGWADGVADGIDSARDHAHQIADTLKEGYQTVKGKAANLSDNLGAATENIGHAVHDASDRLIRSTTEQRYLGKTSAGLVDKVKKQAQEGYDAVRDTVTKTTEQPDDGNKPDAVQNAINSSTDLSRGLGTS